MTNDELVAYAADHLYYELSQWYESGARLVNDPKIHEDFIVKNALIESFAIHSRVLSAFLFPLTRSRVGELTPRL